MRRLNQQQNGIIKNTYLNSKHYGDNLTSKKKLQAVYKDTHPQSIGLWGFFCIKIICVYEKILVSATKSRL